MLSILKDPVENIAKDVATSMYGGGIDIVCVLFPCVNNSSDVFQMVSGGATFQDVLICALDETDSVFSDRQYLRYIKVMLNETFG